MGRWVGVRLFASGNRRPAGRPDGRTNAKVGRDTRTERNGGREKKKEEQRGGDERPWNGEGWGGP